MFTAPIASEIAVRTMRDHLEYDSQPEYVYDPLQMPFPQVRAHLASALLAAANFVAPAGASFTVRTQAPVGA